MQSYTVDFFLQVGHIRMGWMDPVIGVLLVELEEGVTWDEIIQGKQYTLDLQEQEAVNYAITDFMWTNQTFPLGGNNYENLAKILQLDAAFGGTIVFVVPTFPLRIALRIASRMFNIPVRTKKHYFVRSRMDALALIAAHCSAQSIT